MNYLLSEIAHIVGGELRGEDLRVAEVVTDSRSVIAAENVVFAAIDGKNPHTANIRFTHDSYVVPLIEVFGFDGYVAKFDTNISKAVSSAPFNKMIPMAANVQLQLYRNKEGKVLVRAMLNEADMTLPIACDTAPFYPWEEFRKAVEGNMNRLIATRDKFLPEWYRQNKK